jgi:hypothetical protein
MTEDVLMLELAPQAFDKDVAILSRTGTVLCVRTMVASGRVVDILGELVSLLRPAAHESWVICLTEHTHLPNGNTARLAVLTEPRLYILVIYPSFRIQVPA